MKRSPFYAVPPAGNRLRPTHVFRGLLPARQARAATTLEGELFQHVQSQHLFYLSSGRAALWLALRAAARLRPDRQEVVVPAYTCPAIVSAVLKAGLKPVLCDVNLTDFGYQVEDLDRRLCGRTLAVIPVHLFGYVSSLGEITALATRSMTWVIEDAAQAFGVPSALPSCTTPSLQGDAVFFSFGRGKPLTALHGGLLAIRSEELGQAVYQLYSTLSEPEGWNHLKYALYLCAYWLFSNPYLYWAPARLPFLHLGETLFEPDFPIHRGSASAARVINALLASLRDEIEARRRNAAYYAEQFRNLPGIESPPHPAYPYLRYPLLACTRDRRDRILRELTIRGVAGALFYPGPLNELPGLNEILRDDTRYPNAESLAQRLVTLPLHSGIRDRERSIVVDAVREACSGFFSATDPPLSATMPRETPAPECRT